MSERGVDMNCPKCGDSMIPISVYFDDWLCFDCEDVADKIPIFNPEEKELL